jgi:hypothetical protein
MMWINDCLKLLGAKFKGRAENGYECYVYTLPGGLEVTVGPRERWWCEKQQGEGKDSLWEYCWPKVNAWTQERDRKDREAADKEHDKVGLLLAKLVQHLTTNDWGQIKFQVGPAVGRERYCPASVYIDGKCEVQVEFGDDGKIEYGSVVYQAITGMPSLKKQLKKRYEFEG